MTFEIADGIVCAHGTKACTVSSTYLRCEVHVASTGSDRWAGVGEGQDPVVRKQVEPKLNKQGRRQELGSESGPELRMTAFSHPDGAVGVSS